ncbi:hypothetical protein RIF29_20345 [Crotalaria pallida]|uniref:Uncharacterized protein n=1 Tax=Crotalaria pallida TaxID=3830 RepID=A0AAN9I689_CROPI
MAKEIKVLACCVEFLPAPVIPQKKVSHSPALETIAEEESEEYDEELGPHSIACELLLPTLLCKACNSTIIG